MKNHVQIILAGDIGATKTILRVFSSSQSPLNPICAAKYPSRDFDSLKNILQIFLEDVHTAISLASFDVAGSVGQ